MAKSGRVPGTVLLVILTLVALPTVVFAAFGSVALISAQADQDGYDKAAFCADAVTDSHDCVLRTTAKVLGVDATRNHGKNAHGYTTKAELDPVTGDSQTVTVSESRDLRADISYGDTWPVLVWRGAITRFTFAGHTQDADENPHQVVAGLLIGVSACVAIGALTGRVVLRRLLRTRIAGHPARHRIPDWTLAGLAVATITAAILRASWFVSGFALAAVAVLLGSAAVWPFLPWVRHPDPESFLGRGRVRVRR
ncbi:MAG: hypothetical protein HOV83_35350 [Catenulispora sp.]|nr:hypothetical protein [Catenulispora sp.]